MSLPPAAQRLRADGEQAGDQDPVTHEADVRLHVLERSRVDHDGAEQAAPALGERDVAADAVEEARAELLLERRDALAYCRLREAQPLGGDGE